MDLAELGGRGDARLRPRMAPTETRTPRLPCSRRLAGGEESACQVRKLLRATTIRPMAIPAERWCMLNMVLLGGIVATADAVRTEFSRHASGRVGRLCRRSRVGDNRSLCYRGFLR